MAVHIGKEVEARFKASGMTKSAFADRLGCVYQSLDRMFATPSWDSQRIKKASEALGFNFFRLLCEEYDNDHGGPKPTIAEERIRTYRSKSQGVDITIHVDPDDDERMQKLIKALQGI